MADTTGYADLDFIDIAIPDPEGTRAIPNRSKSLLNGLAEITVVPNGAKDSPAKSILNGTRLPTGRSATALEFCEWCRQPLGPRNSSGRTRVYCSQSCRQRAYQSRKRSRQLSLREGELVVSTVLVDRMNRRLRALDLALAEVEEANLDSSDDRIAHLCQAARRLRRQVIGPPAR
jgi:hypothetical protein